MDAIKIILGCAIYYKLTVIADKLDKLYDIQSELMTVESSLNKVITTLGYDHGQWSIGSSTIIQRLGEILNAIYTLPK